MPDDQIQNEIDELHAQVAELTAARESANKASKKKTVKKKRQSNRKTTPDNAATGNNVTTDSDKNGSASETDQPTTDHETELTGQFQELIDTIDMDLKEASPATVLVVFAIGVLVGRLLPR
ncbi:MAG: hypothetical protein ACN4GM_12045 [Gammaproteobacteria bacterium]